MVLTDLSLHLHGHFTAFVITEVSAHLLIDLFIAHLLPIFRRETQLGTWGRKLNL
jgi:hypothetical protein